VGFTFGLAISNKALAAGELDWGGNYIPNIQQNYPGKNPNFHMVNIPLSIAFLVGWPSDNLRSVRPCVACQRL
jgi:hypothetical protein